ncbi:hypothetical protein [Paraburkholderia sp. BL17N1]|uniref:hypothetical protein n=1 Tax=Paraburkholderia sp. BL17N1 TaxID=1938798 RepID=UPI000EAFD807|nr:hypothetical protein [Paraburkholderia sp. BL17N1]RKR46288.1 hypothetical protein B0G82_3970 [Paraburkholderia sp. BL17N1]
MGARTTYELWTNAEEATLRKMYEAGVEVRDIAASISRHNEDGVRSRAYHLGLKRPADYVQPHYSENWERIEKALRAADAGMTADEITAATGIHTSAVYKLLNHRRGRIAYVCDWRPAARKPAAVWALGALPDATPPLTHRQKRKLVNPFAIAAGLVQPPVGCTGRVYCQTMNAHDDELEAA